MSKAKKAIKQLLALTLSLAITLTLLVSISPQAEASPDITASFTDPNFLAMVRELPGVPSTGPILANHVVGITELSVGWRSIQNLAGIEHFTALKELFFMGVGVGLTTLDVSNNLALTRLDVRRTQLTELDMSNNVALEVLVVVDSELTTLDVSNNLALTRLSLTRNRLTTLNVNNNLALEHLGVLTNRLTELDVSNNLALTHLDVRSNQLTELDVSNNLALTSLSVGNNQLTELDVSNNLALTSLSVGYNQLTELDVSNNLALTSLSVGSRLNELDVSNNLELRWLQVRNIQLKALDVSNNLALTTLDVARNLLTTLDVSNNPELTRLDVNGNQLTKLDVSNNSALPWLDIRWNNIASAEMIIGVENTMLPSVDSGTEAYWIVDPAFLFTPQNTLTPPPLEFAVTVINGTSSTATATAGATVAISATTPPSGQRFLNWTTTSAGVVFADANSVSTTFVMPNQAVTVTANFENIPQQGNGQEPSPPPPPPPPPPPHPNEWQPPVPVPELFDDSQNHWAAGVRNPDDTNYIGWAVANEITSGFTDGTFRPNDSVTRAQFTAFLYRIAVGGEPPESPELGFADMRQTQWHHDYVAWAYSEDIVTGFQANNTFRPGIEITREQLVLMLFRYAGDSTNAVSTNVLGNFADSYRTSAWAREAMNWAAYHELIGRGGTLNPGGNATRAETLAILHRVVDTFNIPAP